MRFLIKAMLFTGALMGSGTLNVQGQGFRPENKNNNPDPNIANCYRDETNKRILPFRVKNEYGDTNSDTPQTCSYWASIQGYKYFGVEFGGECWAGDITVRLDTSTAATNCDVECKSKWGGNDDSTTKCGGREAINIFTTEFPKYEYVGCYQDSENRDLEEKLVDWAIERPERSYILNAAACAYRAQRAGYKYFSLQNGAECWGGNTYGRMGAAQNCAVSNCPNEAPKFNSDDKCGGFYINAVYRLTDAFKKDSLSSLVGCYRDDVNTRDLPSLLNSYGGSLMDYQSCSFLAKKYGYTFFGLQYGFECWGGNTVGRYGLIPSSECNSPCNAKSPGENCGGWKANYVYATKPPSKSCSTDQYYDVGSNNCQNCPDSQWSNGGAIWSCYPCFGGAGSRSINTCKRIVPPLLATATATISGVTVTVTDEEISEPVPDNNNNNNNNKIGIIVGTSIAGCVVLLMGASILYKLYRRRQHIKQSANNEQPQPLETSSGAV